MPTSSNLFLQKQLYEVLSFKAPAKNDKTSDEDTFMDNAGGKADFYLIGIGIHSVLYYIFYARYPELSDGEKQLPLTTIEKVGFIPLTNLYHRKSEKIGKRRNDLGGDYHQ